MMTKSIDNSESFKNEMISKNICDLRGYFIDEAINIQQDLIQIIAQYCCENHDTNNCFIYCLMKQDITFDGIIHLFKNPKTGILQKLKDTGLNETKINSFITTLEDVRDIRNIFAHWVRDDSTVSLYSSSNEISLNQKTKEKYFNTFKEAKNKITAISCTFLHWDPNFVMLGNWSHAKTAYVHNERIKSILEISRKMLRKKYRKTFKEFIELLNLENKN